MPTYIGHPTLKDGTPPLTDRQQERLTEWIAAIQAKGMHLPGRHALSWRVEDEHREGRGHDIEATAMDGEYAAWLTIDVYGNGDEGWATLLTEHNSANDECPCEDCTAYREEG